LAHGLDVRQPQSLRAESEAIARFNPDLLVVVAYGLILPAAVLRVPRHGCINVHASLLPRWRGAAPIARAIGAGDPEAGITIMQMEAGLDTGPMLLQRSASILDTDTATTLEERLSTMGAEAMVSTIERLETGELIARPQDNSKATYAAKLQKSEAPIDWSQTALQLHRKIRALNPWPVATTSWRGQTLRVWDVGTIELAASPTVPGTVIIADAGELRVQTGDGLLNIQRLQAMGARALNAKEFLNGTPMRSGDRLGT